MVATPRSGAIEASKLTQAPGGPSLVLYMTEINTLPGTPLSPMGFAEWDIWNPTEMTFNERGITNPTPRMIHARDRRHRGYTTIVFLDGHIEKRRLRTNDLPITLFNPLHRRAVSVQLSPLNRSVASRQAFCLREALSRSGISTDERQGPNRAQIPRAYSRMVADDVRRRILARQNTPPRYLVGYAICVDS